MYIILEKKKKIKPLAGLLVKQVDIKISKLQ